MHGSADTNGTMNFENISPRPADGVAMAVAEHLTRLGRDPDIVTADALTALRDHYRGSKQRLQALVTAVLFLASTDEASVITADLVERAAAETQSDVAHATPANTVGPRHRRPVVSTLRPSLPDRLVPSSDAQESGTSRTTSCAIATIACLAVVAVASSFLSGRQTVATRPASPVASVPVQESRAQPDRHQQQGDQSTPQHSASAEKPQFDVNNPIFIPTRPPVAAVPATQPHVIINFMRYDQTSWPRAQDAARELSKAGIKILRVRATDSDSRAEVEYCFPEDRIGAEEVSRLLSDDNSTLPTRNRCLPSWSRGVVVVLLP
jgi:hypothetical protein